jgi:hypothetical protein
VREVDPHATALFMLVCTRFAKVYGLRPKIKRLPSLLNPLTRVQSPSNADRRSSKANFQAMGVKTPPWGLPYVYNYVSVAKFCVTESVCNVFVIPGDHIWGKTCLFIPPLMARVVMLSNAPWISKNKPRVKEWFIMDFSISLTTLDRARSHE